MTAVREAASPTHARIGYAPVKRALDAALAATGLIALAPLMLLLAVAIKLESRGPTLYRGTRVGLNGRDFTMLKFRTMIIGAERGPSSTSADDHRITRVGAVLRRFKLDELPQMLNVLRGDMSLVGPRPQVRWAVDLYRPEERLLLSVRPGITDYASIRYRNEAEILRGSPRSRRGIPALDCAGQDATRTPLRAHIVPGGRRAPDSGDVMRRLRRRSDVVSARSGAQPMSQRLTPDTTAYVYRTPVEVDVGKRVAEIFDASPDSLPDRLDTFPRYVRRVPLKRFLALYELFKRVLPVKGSVVECGVFRGFGLMTWAKLSAILEPENLTRRIYGFDTFAGFPDVSARDQSDFGHARAGDLHASSENELRALIAEYDRDRYLGHIPKVELVAGDIADTAPAFVQSHPHLVVSLLYIDCDLYEPTCAALRAFVPRMPRGAVIAFDELDNPIWPGETLAVLDTLGIGRLRLERMEWDPYIAFATIE